MSEEARRKLAGQMVRELPRFGQWAMAVRDFETPYGKVGYRQLAILWALRFNLLPEDDVTPSRFAKQLEVQPSVVTRILAKLEANQFIVRKVDPNDGRRFPIEITQKGIHVSEVVEEVFVQELLAGVAFLDDDALQHLAHHIEVLTEIVTKLEENRKLRGASGSEAADQAR